MNTHQFQDINPASLLRNHPRNIHEENWSKSKYNDFILTSVQCSMYKSVINKLYIILQKSTYL